MEGRSIKILKEKAEKLGYNVEKLPSGALIFVKNNEAEIQFVTVLDAYYVKYIKSGKAYVIYNLSDDIVEAVLRGRLSELKNSDVVEIPSD
ncbi:hypothetical protein [Sulfolobus acidocaldarius]|uniref:hypothetical protein n=1 Tax=Sulfolobus acidocaldarius TaxID=2285 RepID=UPI000784A96A|nr:hypothetical protein [Sulfolobus acidocaldarius]